VVFLVLRQFLDLQVAERHGAVVALEEDGAWFRDVSVNFRSGGFRANHVVMNLLAVEDHGDFVADDGGFQRLPFVAGFGGENVRSFEAVYCSIAAGARLSALAVAQNLDLMAASQIETAVGAVRDHEFAADREVPIFLLRDQIVAVFPFVDRVLQDATGFDGPKVLAIGIAEFPAVEVFAVKKSDKAGVGGSQCGGAGKYQSGEEGSNCFHGIVVVRVGVRWNVVSGAMGSLRLDWKLHFTVILTVAIPR
jgi:hypothetical protein